MTDFEVIIVGGGCHGVGLLHDLASRRLSGVHLIEEKTLSSGTSSRSTKLVHGGLRYLERLAQWPLVNEALRERTLLLRLLKGLVQPLPFVLPVFKGDRPSWMLRTGLFIYDTMAGDGGLPRSRKLSDDELFTIAPYLNRSRIDSHTDGSFLYYDAQMLDDVIVRVAAEAAKKLGASWEENASATQVTRLPNGNGFKVRVESSSGVRELTSRIVVNAAGAWNNANLLRWNIMPRIRCLLNQGSHIVFRTSAIADAEPKTSAACLLQNKDGRVVFFIPWNGEWLLGTTESVLPAHSPRGLKATPEEIKYLIEAAQLNLNINTDEKHISEVFAGVRTMPILDKHHHFAGETIKPQWQENPFASPAYLQTNEGLNISALSRETIIDETLPGLFSIYGGKYTTYRAECEKLAARICRQLGKAGQSTTCSADAWFLHELLEEKPEIFASSPATRTV